MAETSGEDYLNELETSSDEKDRDLAKRIREAKQLTVAESPFDKPAGTRQVVDTTPFPRSKGEAKKFPA